MTNVSVSVFRGFSYVEILISFLILSSGILACVMLIARIQLLQIQSNQTLKATFMADYMVNRLAISTSHCQISRDQSKANRPSSVCVPKSVLLAEISAAQQGAFYASSPLLEGYAALDLNAINLNSPLGCIIHDSASNTYVISIFMQDVSGQDLTEIDCSSQLNGLHLVVRYVPLSALGRNIPSL
jgi:hypothetical protein